jgi:hypothetical protein
MIVSVLLNHYGTGVDVLHKRLYHCRNVWRNHKAAAAYGRNGDNRFLQRMLPLFFNMMETIEYFED